MNLEQLRKTLADEGLPGVEWCEHDTHMTVTGPRGELVAWVSETAQVPELGPALVIEGRLTSADGQVRDESHTCRNMALAMIVLRRPAAHP